MIFTFSDKLYFDMDSQFRTDFEQFQQKILSGKSDSEIRKSYLKLLKIYHPDKAQNSQKKLQRYARIFQIQKIRKIKQSLNIKKKIQHL
jgi:hypothetical protein